MPKKRRKTKKRKTRKRKAKKKDKILERWFFTILTIIVLFTIIFSIPSEKNEILEQEQQILTEVEIQYTCKRDSECFLVNCKSTPNIVECVNVIGQETYYENCKAYWDVNVVQDFTKCACIDGACK